MIWMKKVAVLLSGLGLVPLLWADTAGSLGVGEELYYVIKYTSSVTGNVIGGYAKVQIVKQMNYKGHDVYVVKSQARTSEILDKIFKIRDTLQTEWDYKNRRPIRSMKSQNEGNYQNYLVTNYDHAKRRATYYRKFCRCDKPGKQWDIKNGSQENLPEGVHDVMSALFSMRVDSRQGYPGHSFYIDMYDDAKLQKFQMNIIAYDTVTTQAGTFKTMKVLPKMETSGFFKQQGDIFVWVSDDMNRYIVKVQGKVPYLPGSFIIELVKIKKGTVR